MRILVATSDVPLVEGGHRVIARALIQALREAGHEAEIITTPQNRFGRQFSAYLATRLTDVGVTGLGDRVDRLISIRFPSYVLKHPDHVCWLNHRMREYYDLWPEWTARLSRRGRAKETIRRTLIRTADSYFLKHNIRKLFAQSRNIQQNLLKWGRIPSEILYPPPPQRNYHTESYGDFILSPSRLAPLKRVPLLIEALARTTGPARAVIMGEGTDLETIRQLILRHGLEKRVTVVGHLSDSEITDLYARCLAVYYAPVNEDFGLVTPEAFLSRKPVLTAADSGGPTELVQDGVNGFVLQPEPGAFAAKIDRLAADPGLAGQLGNAGYEGCRDNTWPRAVERLLRE